MKAGEWNSFIQHGKYPLLRAYHTSKNIASNFTDPNMSKKSNVLIIICKVNCMI